jgi:hypothetical protein
MNKERLAVGAAAECPFSGPERLLGDNNKRDDNDEADAMMEWMRLLRVAEDLVGAHEVRD